MFADVNGTKIHYEVTGDGALQIVFVHGLGGTANVWHAQRSALGKYCKVLTYDLSGCGLSDRTKTEYSIDGFADELAGVIQAAGFDKPVVVGHSMSTLTVQRYAIKYGGRLSALVLAGPITELPQGGKDAVSQRAAKVEAEGMAAVADQVLAGALSPRTHQANPALAGLLREVLLSNCRKCYAGHCRALAAGSVKGEQAKISVPTLVIDGDQDPVTPLANAIAISREMPNCRVRIVPGTAHMTMLESPDAFNTALVEFLATLR